MRTTCFTNIGNITFFDDGDLVTSIENAILDKYDVETKFDWTEYLAACSQYFDAIR